MSLVNRNLEHAEFLFQSGDEKESYHLASEIFSALSAKPLIIKSGNERASDLIRLGNLLFNLGDFLMATECFSLVQSSGCDKDLQLFSQIKKSLSLSKTGQFSDAIWQLKEVLSLPSPNPSIFCYAQKYLADIYHETGLLSLSLRHYEKACNGLKFTDGFSDSWYPELLNNMALVNLELGNVSLSLAQFREALDLTEQACNPEMDGLKLWSAINLAALYSKLERKVEAKMLLDSVELEKLSDEDKLRVILFKVQTELNNPDMNLSMGSQDFLTVISYPIGAVVSDTEALVADLQSHIHLRFENFLEATSLQKQLITYYTETSNYHRATNQQFILCQYYLCSGETFRNNEIVDLLKEIETKLKTVPVSNYVYVRSIEIARIYCRLEMFAAACNIITRILEYEPIFMQDLMVSGSDEFLYYYDYLNLLADITLAISENTASDKFGWEAHFINMKIRCQNLSGTREEYFRKYATNTAIHTSDLLLQYRMKVKRLLTAGPTEGAAGYEKLRGEVNSLIYKIKQESGYFSAIRNVIESDWEQIRQRIKDHEVALLFVRYNSFIANSSDCSSYAVILIKKGLDLPARIPLMISDEFLRESLPFNIVRNYPKGGDFVLEVEERLLMNSALLYQHVIEPLEPYLQGVKRLYYSTEGLANFIPFYALSCGKGLFLSDRFELIQLLNIRDILNQQAISRLDSIALFGGIDFGAGETKPEVSHKPKSNLSSVEAIPGATTEIERIAKLFRETGAQAKEHCELDKETLSTSCMSQPGCIHVLSHGFFFNDPKLAYDLVPVPEYIASDIKTHTNPLLRSGLIASNYNILLQSSDIKPGDTGVITSHDIAALNLKETGLVTIHACETALGAVRNGETYGLILAFKMAGVKFVILTLWKIMHTDFFILFYQYLLEDPDKEVRKAFTRAVVTLRQKHPNPFYWGGFILVE